MNENIEKVLAALDGFRMSDEMTYSAYSVLHDEISLLDDLLKAQEPRVMTLEEAQKWVEIPLESRDPVFYEDRILERAWWIWNADDRRTYLPAIIGGIGRFWTSRPSKKQREATPWVT